MKLRRSLMISPADRPGLVEKAAALHPDVLIVELEDGVAPGRKAEARIRAGEVFRDVDFEGAEKALRVNRINTIEGLRDLEAVAAWEAKPDLIVVPKVESVGEVQIYHDLLVEAGAEAELLVIVESSKGVRCAPDILSACSRVTAASLGGADLSAELGCALEWEALLVFRSLLVAAAGPRGLGVIDLPYLSIKDDVGLRDDCRRARILGFTGKICIHPSQVATVNDAFSPSEEEVARARKVAEAVAIQGHGAILVDGRMVDAAVVRSALRTVAMADELEMGNA